MKYVPGDLRPWGLILFTAFVSWSFACQPVMAESEDKVVPDTEAVEATEEAQAEQEWADMTDEELQEAVSEVRSELVGVRVKRQRLRYEWEREDEDARALMTEMTRLRQQLHEKSAELEALLAEDESFSELSAKESELIDRLSEVSTTLRERAPSSGDDE